MTDDKQQTNDRQDEPIAWRAIIYDTPVYATGGGSAGGEGTGGEGTGGERIGLVREVLGSDAEDVFHGVRVELDQDGRHVMVLADDVSLITRSRLETRLSPEAVAALPEYRETDTYHLASVGWLRKHLGWRRDSTGDEEPG